MEIVRKRETSDDRGRPIEVIYYDSAPEACWWVPTASLKVSSRFKFKYIIEEQHVNMGPLEGMPKGWEGPDVIRKPVFPDPPVAPIDDASPAPIARQISYEEYRQEKIGYSMPLKGQHYVGRIVYWPLWRYMRVGT